MNSTPAHTHKELIGGIQDKLAVIVDLFNFYQTIEDHNLRAEFTTKTFKGIIGIVDDCIDKLEVL